MLEETFLSVGWFLYGTIVGVLIKYDVVYLPILIFLYQRWWKLLDDDNYAGIVKLSTKGLLIDVATFGFVYALFFYPNYQFSNLVSTKHNIANQGNDQQIKSPYNDRFIKNVQKLAENNNINTNTIKVPLGWAALDAILYKLRYELLKVLPKSAGDVRTAMTQVEQYSRIENPETRAYYDQFYRACYQPALSKFNTMVDSGKITKDNWFYKIFSPDIDIEEYDWAGGSFFFRPGFYQPCQKGQSCYDDSTPSPLGVRAQYETKEGTQTVTKIIYCDKLWDKYVRPKLVADFKIKSYEYGKNAKTRPLESKLIRKMLIVGGIDRAKAVQDTDAKTRGGISSILTYPIVAVISGFAKIVVSFINQFIIAALPIYLGALMSIYIFLLPFALIVLAMKVEYIIDLMMGWFILMFLPVIWAIIAFFDNNILKAIYGTGNENEGLITLASNIMASLSLTGLLISIITVVMYWVATTKFIELMGSVSKIGRGAISSGMADMNKTGKIVQQSAPKPKF